MKEKSLPEGKTDTVDEEHKYCQTEDTQKSVHSDLEVRQPSGGLSQFTLPRTRNLHLCWVAVAPRWVGASTPAAAAASAGSSAARSPRYYRALCRCANLIREKTEIANLSRGRYSGGWARSCRPHLPHRPFLPIRRRAVGLPLPVLRLQLACAVVHPGPVIVSSPSSRNPFVVFAPEPHGDVANARRQHAFPFRFLAGLGDDHLHSNQRPLSVALGHYGGPVLLLGGHTLLLTLVQEARRQVANIVPYCCTRRHVWMTA